MTEPSRLFSADHGPSVDIPRILLQGMGAAFFIQVAGTGVGYIGQVLLARWIGVEEYGSYTFVFTWAQMFAVLALIGFDIGVVRFLPGYLVRSELAHLRGLIRWSRFLALGVGVVLSLGTVLAALVFRRVPIELSAFLLGALLIPILSLSEIQTQIIRSKPRIALAYGPPVLVQPLVFLGGAAFILAIWKTLTAPLAVVALGFSFLVVIAI